MANGSGDMKPGDEAPPGTKGSGDDVCPECNGTGKIETGPCPECDGTGVITRAIGGG